ncbi:MAG: UDP-glucose/GDP-mannose dehydrogenase family protein, partial [Flavobacteriales bacterium]|nr:UDP-glucose/GDP-mannose dehydrogenase family protein [Flavobacteriales bacterium]
MNVGVFGLGYVGVVNMACLGKLGHSIYGCDVKPQKVDAVRTGKSPIYEPGVDDLLGAMLNENRLQATTDASEVVRNTSIALICVGTPSREDGTVNLDYTLNTANEIARIVLALNKTYTVVFRSTIPPGTTESLLAAEFKKVMGEKASLVTVAFLPEFLREGSAVSDFFNGPRIVIGCDGEAPADLAQLFSYNPETPVVFT